MDRFIEVVQLSPGVWRLHDLRMAPEDPRRLLGFIELKGEGYEAMQLGSRFAWSTSASLDEAIAQFENLASDGTAPGEHVLSWMLTDA